MRGKVRVFHWKCIIASEFCFSTRSILIEGVCSDHSRKLILHRKMRDALDGSGSFVSEREGVRAVTRTWNDDGWMDEWPQMDGVGRSRAARGGVADDAGLHRSGGVGPFAER
jgi:hypothetical protein